MPSSDAKTYIVNDQPTEKDALDFTPYVETLADIIQTGNTPLTIGVFGGWGSGKTSLMKMVKNQLPDEFTVAWFDAWKYDKEETLWRAFLLSVLSAVRSAIKVGQPTEDLEYLETMLYRGIEIEKAGGVTIDLAKLGGAVAKGGIQLALSFIPGGAVLSEFVKKVQELGADALTNETTDAIQRERTKIQIEQVRFLEQFQDKFRILIEQHVSNNGKRLVVFVDDLDRCLPEKAIQVLEAIKLFLDAENCVFMLGLDQEVIARGIEMKYKELGEKQEGDSSRHFTIEGARYLEKIIQLPFQIPPVEQSDMGDFVQGLSAEWPHEECWKVFAEGLGDNPRQIKRTVNTFLMLWKLADKRKAKLQGHIKPVRLAKALAIQAIYPELYNIVKETPRYLRDLETYYRLEAQDVTGKEINELPPSLKNYISRPAIRRLLTMHPAEQHEANFISLTSNEINIYFTQLRLIEAPRLTGSSIDILEPQMVRIRAGKFLMGSTPRQIEIATKNGTDVSWLDGETPQHEVELSEYYIGKYPVTNREYQVFIRSTKRPSPLGWSGADYPAQLGDCPTVHVSWYDAQEYCEWLSSRTGKNYRLPTEAEWEKAARGEKGLLYPWGNAFEANRANTSEGKSKRVTPVGQFSPNGDSPYGCADMIGNVWEWCNDLYDEKEYKKRLNRLVANPQGSKQDYGYRVCRGGSFEDHFGNARCALRISGSANNASRNRGFRVVLLPNNKETSNNKTNPTAK